MNAVAVAAAAAAARAALQCGQALATTRVTIRPAGAMRDEAYVERAGGMGGKVQRTFSGASWWLPLALHVFCTRVAAGGVTPAWVGARCLSRPSR